VAASGCPGAISWHAKGSPVGRHLYALDATAQSDHLGLTMKDAQLLDQMKRCNLVLVTGSFAIVSGLFTLWNHFQHTVEEQALSNGLLIGLFSLSTGSFAFGLSQYTKLKAQKQLELRYLDKNWTGVRNEY
jgi:hypothetical protein